MGCRAPTLIVASAADRLLPSLEESGRLVGKIPDARRVILPNSGHTALLESGISLAEIMGRTGFLPSVSTPYILHWDHMQTCFHAHWCNIISGRTCVMHECRPECCSSSLYLDVLD